MATIEVIQKCPFPNLGMRRPWLPLIALVIGFQSLAALGNPETYSGLDPNPEATPVVEGARFFPEEIPTPKATLEAPRSAGEPKAEAPKLSKLTPQTRRSKPETPKTRVSTRSQAKTPSKAALKKEVADLRRQVERLKVEIESQRRNANDQDSCSSPRGTYDPVPSDQAETVARRLGLVARLILGHGRAYDYRTSTTRDLKEVLSKLETTSPNNE